MLNYWSYERQIQRQH
uniref:Uncharacterized protein n=1 Tax=Arundo donax TaxID=35708 RepID=A0A0A9A6K2_ARUDO